MTSRINQSRGRIRGFVNRFAGVAAVAVASAGCGDGVEPARNGSATTSEVESGGAFPLAIDHAFGQTVIESEPTRVVVVGLNEADFLYSLGIAPVGVHEWWAGYDYATGPWAEPVRAALGAEPAVLEEWEVDVEWVAAQQPDLIVATYHDIDQSMYDLLSEVAPVVAQPAEYDTWSTPWREQLRQIARAVGRVDRAEEVIADVDALIDQIVADHPSLAGKTFNTGGLSESGGFTLYSSADVANQSLAELSMSVPSEHDAIADGVFVEISAERLDLIDLLDVLVILDDSGEAEAKLAGIATFAVTDLATEGRVVIPEFDQMVAMSFNTPLSIPFYLAELAPMLEAAVDGDPSTGAPE